MPFAVEINGEPFEARTLAEFATSPEVAASAVESLAVIAKGADATIDLVALSLDRPRAWVANNVTAEEAGRVLAGMNGKGA